MTASAQLVSITACVEHFAAQGRDVDRSTISRFVKKHGLAEGRGKGNAVLVNADRVWRAYASDYQREIMSGEASGLVQPRAPEHAAISPSRLEGQEEAAAGDPGPNVEPIKSAAVLEKEQRVRQLTRENDIAEGKLVPAVEVSAALVSAVAEMRTVWKRRQREFVERVAGTFGLDTAAAIEFKAMLNTFLAAGQNAFSAELQALLTAREDDQGAVAGDFEVLVSLAVEQAERRAALRTPDAA